VIRRRRADPPRGQLQRALRRSRWRAALAWAGGRWPALVLGSAALAGAGALAALPDFRVTHVTVRHEAASSDEVVTRATQLAQVVGHNVFLVNSQRIADEVASIPSVLRARVIPHLPDTVEIEIVERKPIAVWRTPIAAFLVDDQGFLMGEATGGAADPAFVVKDGTGRELQLGGRVDQRALLAARELVKAMPAAGVRVREVELGPSGLVFTSDTGWRIIVGETDALNAKLANLATVTELAQKNGLKIALLDLRPKDRPFYQLAP
jgi:cell division protein FtsQ